METPSHLFEWANMIFGLLGGLVTTIIGATVGYMDLKNRVKTNSDKLHDLTLRVSAVEEIQRVSENKVLKEISRVQQDMATVKGFLMRDERPWRGDNE